MIDGKVFQMKSDGKMHYLVPCDCQQNMRPADRKKQIKTPKHSLLLTTQGHSSPLALIF